MRLISALVVISASLAFAEEADPVEPAMKKALEQANGIPDFASLARAAHQKTKSGWEATWAHPIGDSGIEECKASFRSDGTLESQKCDLEYVSHSMGPMNARWKTKVSWTFDATGKRTAFKGTRKSVLLSTGKVGENKTYTAPDEDLLADLCKPLMVLDESMRR
ncbi:MAG: hypothetical protein U0228_00345 [Myxococcaceae bacterium]